MREIYRQELSHLGNDLESLAKLVAKALDRARLALAEQDLELAEETIDADDRIDDLAMDIEGATMHLLALQAPVATDLRLITGTMRLAQNLERMGDMAMHVAQVARAAYPEPATPSQIQEILIQMAKRTLDMTLDLGTVIKSSDAELAQKIIDTDDEIDELHRKARRLIRDPEVELTRDQIINGTLLSRFLERTGDHASKAASRIIFMIRGEYVPH
ncbi:phosphate transport system regulatory protein PhoU [Boudabousia liubingyangii]|uniref:Phosphate-specific transport system accessory protein PhoU n=1 Tax=Boudabousia liubingyangii TaxID=1921764 RepID=A0A1Q5PK06_9ACTO|nr:phosphate signaling complex protein PhoU [Boudabousia liubingyangii]OKL46556.1 phosphate transport system regulatory protein PhoU [Boudabousia liubingyangii]OKL46859.1 phosphate transport system regulatory protein PhoU [Boudabousia liubingyangii]